ncbi:MAG: sigma-70 family RNA polymerase sigma factor [Chloroflexi bacterium]|nr:MAG: sigma-70 family RNA polymerase sigma factor [Chloroflexota bacterium]
MAGDNGRFDDTPKVTEYLDILLNQAESQGYLTYDDILSLLPEVEEDLETLAALLEDLDAAGIPVLTDESEVKSRLAREEAGERREPTPPTQQLMTEDTLDLYLQDIGQEPLLSWEEEVQLAKQIERGKRAQKALKRDGLNPAERARLQALVEAGQAARERLSQANTRLVISIAKRYRGYGLPFADLIQEGNVGLMRAVDRYDYRQGNRFSTYATWWIRQAVTRALADQGRTIRLPVHTGDRLRRTIKVIQQLEQELGRRPTPEEIARHTGDEVSAIRDLLRLTADTISLDQPAGREEDAELADFVQDESALSPEEEIDRHLLHELLQEAMHDLTPREVQILRLRYGLQDGKKRTLKEVAQAFGLSRERVRQIEHEALDKLRQGKYGRILRQFLAP